MDRIRSSRPFHASLWTALALAVFAPATALAAHGGGGGDSSMNPYTGDSYAYFHGGHNLGEAGTVRPGGVPPPTGWSLIPQRATRQDASGPAPTARWQAAPTTGTTSTPPNASPDAPAR
jgi:hypothetical protein